MTYRQVVMQWGMENPCVLRNKYIESTTVAKMLWEACRSRKKIILGTDDILEKTMVVTTPQQSTHVITVEKSLVDKQETDEDMKWIAECVEDASLIVYGYTMGYRKYNAIDSVSPHIFFGNTITSIRSAARQLFKDKREQIHFAGFLYKANKTVDIGVPIMAIDDYIGETLVGKTMVDADNYVVEDGFLKLLSGGCCPLCPNYHPIRFIGKDNANAIVPWCSDIIESIFNGTDLIASLIKLQISASKFGELDVSTKNVEIAYNTVTSSENASIGTDQFCKIITRIVMNSPYIIFSTIDLAYNPKVVRIFAFESELPANEWWQHTENANLGENAGSRLLLGAWVRTSCVRYMGWPVMSLFAPSLTESCAGEETEEKSHETDHDDTAS